MTVNGVYYTVGENNLLQFTTCAGQHGNAAIVGEVEPCHVGPVTVVLSQFLACRYIDAGYRCVITTEVAQVSTTRNVDRGQVRTSEAVEQIQVLAVRDINARQQGTVATQVIQLLTVRDVHRLQVRTIPYEQVGEKWIVPEVQRFDVRTDTGELLQIGDG